MPTAAPVNVNVPTDPTPLTMFVMTVLKYVKRPMHVKIVMMDQK